MIDKEKAIEHIKSSQIDILLMFAAKNYAVNAMILRRLSLIFAVNQKGAPLTPEEVAEVSEMNKNIQIESEETVLKNLFDSLEIEQKKAIFAALNVVAGEEQ